MSQPTAEANRPTCCASAEDGDSDPHKNVQLPASARISPHQGGPLGPLTIHNLGPELIVEVFSHLRIRDLCKVALVCKLFKELAYFKRLWQREELILQLMCSIDPAWVPSLLQKGIRRLAIQAYTQRDLLENIRYFPALESLSLGLHSEAFDFGEWKPFDGLHLPTLKMLELECIDTRYIIDESLAVLAAKWPNLEELSCTTGFFPFPKEGLTSKGLHAFFDQMKKLKVLNLQFREVPLDIFSAYESYSDTVEVLSVSIENLDGVAMKTISRAFPKLRLLKFTECNYVGDFFIDDCLDFLIHIPRLKFDRCRNVQRIDIQDLRAGNANIDFEPFVDFNFLR